MLYYIYRVMPCLYYFAKKLFHAVMQGLQVATISVRLKDNSVRSEMRDSVLHV
jgi:hypothetical protein